MLQISDKAKRELSKVLGNKSASGKQLIVYFGGYG